MATVLLVRHGLTGLTGPVLSGHTPGIDLDDRGRAQAAELADRLRPVRLAAIVTSPLARCVQTAAAVATGRDGLAPEQDDRLMAAVRDWNARLGKDATWLACSHGDVIKALLADALGMHLDLFQRIVVEPCSVSVVRYTDVRPFVLRMNDTGGDVQSLLPPKRTRSRSQPAADAAVGGGAGVPG